MMTIAQQVEMCGESFKALEDGYLNRMAARAPGTGTLYIMGFLSDAQEMMAHGDVEGARKILNGAKYLMSEYHMGDRT